MNLYDQIGDEKIDLLIDILYDEIIANDDRINILFHNGFEKVKMEQKRFFRMYLGAPGNIFSMPNLKQKHYIFPISAKEARYWAEDFEKALEKLELDETLKQFLAQKIRTLASQMINTLK
ncbi:truncated hemoglobin [Gemella sp. zg-1178]|uniref:truncated hemoglobin n=1 Tax=Gemella sp. zg-1178 TaxID=2840372 RepID=UPI001C043006|nr:protozoan/cyanobacterial protein, globin family [Gemella sp. zg-1178]MBU0278625.1 protozoan/cyanobacterial protein, globin family [Gemella sp. zg-1178]